MNKVHMLNGGHIESVLSLDTNNSGILASGSEDCLCIWTTEGTPLTKIYPLGDTTEVPSVSFCKRKPEQLFCSSGTKVFNYDLRSLSSPICEFSYNDDEINQIAVHDRGQFVAACDDTGCVRVIDVQQKTLFKTLNRCHSNICSSVQFRPQRPWDLVTGGMDFKVVFWDFSCGRATHEVNVLETGADADKYFINPPFVHSVHMHHNSRDFAVGLGDGSIELFHFEGKKKIVADQKLKGHTLGVSQVHFPHFQNSPNALISGGNDENLILWNYSTNQNGVSSHGNIAAAANPSANEQGYVVNCKVEHDSKVSWITSFSGPKDLVYVGDLTSQISIYEITG